MKKHIERGGDDGSVYLALSADRELLAVGGMAANAALKRWRQSRRAAAQLAVSGRLGVENTAAQPTNPSPDLGAENVL